MQTGHGLRRFGVFVVFGLPPVPGRHRTRPARLSDRPLRQIDKLARLFQPSLIHRRQCCAADRAALEHVSARPASGESTWPSPPTAFPQSMAGTCQYESQLRETCRLTAEAGGASRQRSGSSSTRAGRAGRKIPGSDPDIATTVRELPCRRGEVPRSRRHADRVSVGPHRSAVRSRLRSATGCRRTGASRWCAPARSGRIRCSCR